MPPTVNAQARHAFPSPDPLHEPDPVPDAGLEPLLNLEAAEAPAMTLDGFLAVVLGAGNAAGGYVVTARMLEMFKPSAPKGGRDEPKEPQA